MPTFLMSWSTGTSVEGSVMVYCASAEIAWQSGCPVIDQGGKIDRGGCGAAGRRQQRLRDCEFDAFAIAGNAEIKRCATVEQSGDAGGCDRVQIGLQHAIRVESELHLILGAHGSPNGLKPVAAF